MHQKATEFKYQKQGNALKIWRGYTHPKAKIWNALTDPDILDRWWAPLPWKCDTKSHDFREGGHWHYAMRGPEGETHWAMAEYQKIKPGTSYTATDFFCDQDGKPNKDLPSSVWEVTLQDHGNEVQLVTTCTFENEAKLDENLNMGFLEGYEMGLNNLDQLLNAAK